MPTATKKSQVASARREYQAIKSLYHNVGKKALGKPTNSKAKRDYRVVKAEYNRIGKKLGRLTGRKSRRK